MFLFLEVGTEDPMKKDHIDKRPKYKRPTETKDPIDKRPTVTKDPIFQKKNNNSTSWIQKQTKNPPTKKSKIGQKLRKNYAMLKDFLLLYGWHQNVVSPDPSGALEAAATIEYTQDQGTRYVNWRQIIWVH